MRTIIPRVTLEQLTDMYRTFGIVRNPEEDWQVMGKLAMITVDSAARVRYLLDSVRRPDGAVDILIYR